MDFFFLLQGISFFLERPNDYPVIEEAMTVNKNKSKKPIIELLLSIITAILALVTAIIQLSINI